jgi:hypothetical protein
MIGASQKRFVAKHTVFSSPHGDSGCADRRSIA